MKKLVLGVLIGLMCGGGAIAIADTAGNFSSKGNSEIKGNVESYIEEVYGLDWANTLYRVKGEEWDDILEDELEGKFGKKYEEIIEDIIDAKEKVAGLDDIDDNKYEDELDEIDDSDDDDRDDYEHEDIDDEHDDLEDIDDRDDK